MVTVTEAEMDPWHADDGGRGGIQAATRVLILDGRCNRPPVRQAKISLFKDRLEHTFCAINMECGHAIILHKQSRPAPEAIRIQRQVLNHAIVTTSTSSLTPFLPQ
jgi:hypothetical protein